MANLVGTIPTHRIAAGDKFRVTWKLQLLPVVGGTLIDAPKAAAALLKTLPVAGFAPVSNPSTRTGDLAIVIDVRLSGTWAGSWSGKTVGDMVAALQRLSSKASFLDALLLNDLTVDRVEALSLSLTSAQLEAGQAGAQQQAQTQQEKAGASLWEQLKTLLGKFATGAGVVVGVVVVGGIAYWYASKGRS